MLNTNRPPGRRTRYTSFTASASRRTSWRTMFDTAISNVPARNEDRFARSPWRYRMSSRSPSWSLVAASSCFAETSTPSTLAPAFARIRAR